LQDWVEIAIKNWSWPYLSLCVTEFTLLWFKLSTDGDNLFLTTT